MAKTRKKTRMHPWVYLAWAAAVYDAQDGKLDLLEKVLLTDFGRSPEAHAAVQWGHAALNTLLKRRNLKRKRGGRYTRQFRLSKSDRVARAAKLARDLRDGRAIPTPLLNKGTPEMVERLPKTREEMKQWRLSQPPYTAIGTISTDRSGIVNLTDDVLQPMSRSEAIKIAAAILDVSDEEVRGYMDGKKGFGRGRKSKGKRPRV